MSRYAYERLTALDNSFLVFESANAPMHVASAGIFEAGPLRTPEGGIDIRRILHYVESRLHKLPRYREKLAYIPFENHPVWVDDERFNLLYHVRHTSLPRPGSVRQLKRLCARILSQQLDRGKPLWEMWVVEGLEGDRMAIISKVHHCMIDGITGADLLATLMSNEPETEIHEPANWIPRPTPSPSELLRDEVRARLRAPIDVLTWLARDPLSLWKSVRGGVAAIADVLGGVSHLGSETPLNRPIGPHRRFDWLSMEIAAVKEIRERVGGTLNDIVLTIVSGAVRRFLVQRNVDLRRIDFRAFVPVNVRPPEARGELGNRVAGWILDLPVDEPQAQRRHERILKETEKAKHSQQARGSQILTEAAEWTGSGVVGLAARLAESALPFNLVVTNVPGPPQPLYMLGSRLMETYPMVPLFVNQGLGIALFSNAGQLFWGFNADWDVVPDLHEFVEAISDSYEELRSIPAGASTAAVRPRRRRKAA